MPVEDELSLEFEARLSREERRRLGAYNTPMAVARAAVDELIDRPGTVCDPSCGTGTFLEAAMARLRQLGDPSPTVVGIDVDPAAVEVARARVPSARVVVGDGLGCHDRYDYVVGNPPYVDRLHARFLEHATRVGDAIAMVVPTSLLATDDGRAARASGFGVVSCTRLERVFDAEVDTCVLVLRRGARVPEGPTWASLLVGPEVPDVALAPARVLGASCSVVAGFRQHYYGLRGHVREGGGGASGLPLVTSGAIDVASWGGRPVRFDGTRYADPRVDLDGVEEPVRSWFRALLVPKVVVATQTRVIEAAVDATGEVVPSVPVIAVVPRDAARVWHVLAVLLAPPVTAWAMRRWGGTALASTALKLGAPHVREIPEPVADPAAWTEAATMLRAGGAGAVEAGAVMCRAYDVGEEVHAWWAARLR